MIYITLSSQDYEGLKSRIKELEDKLKLNEQKATYCQLSTMYYGGHGAHSEYHFSLFNETEALEVLRKELLIATKEASDNWDKYIQERDKKKSFWS